jgi:hypothetical protein
MPAMARSDNLPFALRAGRARIEASASAEALRTFVASANEARHIEGLSDELNPALLDADKVAHLVAGLRRLPAASLAPLDGHDLYLDAPGLHVRAGFPSQAASFDAPFDLRVDEIQGNTVLAHVTAPIDAALARTRSAAAAPAYAALAQDAQDRPAKERRRAVAQFWYMNAAAWAEAAPDDAAAATAAKDARAAVSASAIPPSGGTEPP